MKVTFFHDHRFRVDTEGDFYSLGGLSNKTLDNYLETFDSIKVVCRKQKFKEYENKNEFTKINLEKIEMDCFEIKNTLQLLGFKGIRKEVSNIVKNSESCIVRVPSFIGLLALEECIKLNKPTIVEVVANGWDSLWNYGSISGKIMAPYIHLKSKQLIKKSSNVIYVTNSYLQKMYPSKGNNIGCSDVVLKKIEPSFERYKGRKEKTIYLGTLAAINVKFKGQECVIKALGYLKKQGYTDFEYQLVGSGSEKYLKELAIKHEVENQVVFLGALPHDEVFDWLSSIDVYIQPSKQEGLPRAVVEAMSTGVFCLGSRTGGIPELLEEGYIFSNKHSNYKEIAKLLKEFNPNDAYREGKNNYEKSLLYEKELLEKKRKDFLNRFVSKIEIEGKL